MFTRVKFGDARWVVTGGAGVFFKLYETHKHWNRKVFILMKFWSLAALEVVKQLPVQPVIKISSKWRFFVSVKGYSECFSISGNVSVILPSLQSHQNDSLTALCHWNVYLLNSRAIGKPLNTNLSALGVRRNLRHLTTWWSYNMETLSVLLTLSEEIQRMTSL